MKLLPSSLLLISALALCSQARAANPIFQIGVFDGSQMEFEAEDNNRNNPQYYYESGSYSAIAGLSQSLVALDYAGAAEVLKTDPEADIPLLGMPRALVPGREVIDIFFQVDAAEALASSFQFATRVMSLGHNDLQGAAFVGSTHSLTFYLNGTAFYSDSYGRTTYETREDGYDVSVTIPSGYVEGSNVLSVRRTAGGANTPWIQFDAWSLNAVPEPTSAFLALGTLGLASLRRRRASAA